MRTLFIALSTFLFTAVQVCGCGNCKANAQTTVKTVTKDEPKQLN